MVAVVCIEGVRLVDLVSPFQLRPAISTYLGSFLQSDLGPDAEQGKKDGSSIRHDFLPA